MSNITYLPKPEELAYNLNKLPKDPEDYKKSIRSLATSVIEYSVQIEQLMAVDSITSEDLSNGGTENGDTL